MHRARGHGWRLHLHRRISLVQQLRVEPDKLGVGRRLVRARQGRSGEQRPLEASQTGASVERRPPSQLTGGAADENILGGCVQHPVVAFARVIVVSRHFHETLVQAEVVADRVLPPLPILPVIGEVGHDVLVDAVQREPLLGTVPDSHHDEGVVTVCGFLVLLVLLLRLVVLGLGAVHRLGAGDVELGVAQVGLRGRGAVGRGRGRRRRLGGRVVHQYRVNTKISFEFHHVDALRTLANGK